MSCPSIKYFILIYFTLNFYMHRRIIWIVPRAPLLPVCIKIHIFIHDIEGALYYEYSENLST